MINNYNLPKGFNGDTFKLITFVFNSLPELDLTGATAKLQVRRISDEVLAHEYSIGLGLTVVLPYTIKLDKHIITIPKGEYRWDLEITYQNGDIYTRIGGKWSIDNTNTR